ncbi:MAG: hypothetical protein WCD86_06505 [Ktedonobacteraceae bacterium]
MRFAKSIDHFSYDGCGWSGEVGGQRAGIAGDKGTTQWNFDPEWRLYGNPPVSSV